MKVPAALLHSLVQSMPGSDSLHKAVGEMTDKAPKGILNPLTFHVAGVRPESTYAD